MQNHNTIVAAFNARFFHEINIPFHQANRDGIVAFVKTELFATIKRIVKISL